MYFILYPLRYLRLRSENGRLVVWRDVLPVLIITIPLVLFFQYVDSANFFGKDGLVDKAGGVTASLTGFYIAGLLAVATFTANNTALDSPIKVGPVFIGNLSHRGEALSRRDYVCLIFGYLSFISLGFSILSVVVAGTAVSVQRLFHGLDIVIPIINITTEKLISLISTTFILLVLIHLVVTTGYGLYYLTSKIYEKEPQAKPRVGPRIRRP